MDPKRLAAIDSDSAALEKIREFPPSTIPSLGRWDKRVPKSRETTKEKSVAYIRIVVENGETIAESGDLPKPLTRPEIQRILTTKDPITRIVKENNTFELARVFKPLKPPMLRRGEQA